MRSIRLALLFTLLITAPWGAHAQYFPAGPAGFTDEKHEDHWNLERADSATEWMRIVGLHTIQHASAFTTWFRSELPAMLDGFFGPAVSRSRMERLAWPPTGRVTLGADNVVVNQGRRITISAVAWETGYGTQLFLILYPEAVKSDHRLFVQAVEYVKSLRDWNFRLTVDMLADGSTAKAAASAPAQQQPKPATSAGKTCRNYQTGFYNKVNTVCNNRGCTTTTTPQPVYSYICS